MDVALTGKAAHYLWVVNRVTYGRSVCEDLPVGLSSPRCLFRTRRGLLRGCCDLARSALGYEGSVLGQES